MNEVSEMQQSMTGGLVRGHTQQAMCDHTQPPVGPSRGLHGRTVLTEPEGQ